MKMRSLDYAIGLVVGDGDRCAYDEDEQGDYTVYLYDIDGDALPIATFKTREAASDHVRRVNTCLHGWDKAIALQVTQ